MRALIGSAIGGAVLAGLAVSLLAAPQPATGATLATVPSTKTWVTQKSTDYELANCSTSTMSKTFTAPDAGLLTIDAQILMARHADTANVAPRLTIALDGVDLTEGTSQITYIVPQPAALSSAAMVTKGTHTVDLKVYECNSGTGDISDRLLFIEWSRSGKLGTGS